MGEHGRSIVFTKIVRKIKEKKMLEDGRLPGYMREGAGPEELMKYVCEASQGTVSI